MSKSNNISVKILQLICVAFIAKGFGFVREMVLAYYYGTTAISDVFIAVQNIPAIIFTVFGTAVTTGFIPLYSELKVKKNKIVADNYANNVFNVFFILSVILSLIGIVFSKQLVYIFASGFEGETFELCNKFAKIIMPTSIAIILVYVYNAYLQIEGMFNQNSLMNVPYNITQILFIVVAFYTNSIWWLAIGLLLASFSQLAYLRILIKKRTKFKHSTYFNMNDQNLIKMLILVGPVFISTGVNQVNSIVDRSLASKLVEGSVSALNYSSEIANIVIQVIILSLTTILYPKMTMLFSQNKENEKDIFIEKYMNIVSFLVFPLTALIFAFSREIVQILFGRGAFTDETVLFVSRALRIYALGIVGVAFRDVLNKVFYAMKNTTIPMINGIIAVFFNIILNFLLITRYEYLGLAFATSMAATVSTYLLFIQLHKIRRRLNVEFIKREFLKSLFSTGIMFIVIKILSSIVKISSDIVNCILFGSIGVIVYLIAQLLLKESIVNEAFNKVIKR